MLSSVNPGVDRSKLLLLEVRDLSLERLARLLVHLEQSVELLVGPGGCGAQFLPGGVQFLPDSAQFNDESVDPDTLLLVLAAQPGVIRFQSLFCFKSAG
ncbi:hypothetical protein BBJ29_005587 [Phytophthora kernoviae]|uniref:Uncharacterized protein n=1 Tax=Phytophthora kernoviae TaxID=325452 RepID=A0A3F2RM56_9STRA|nr:hypothetical protein BBP00_00006770 [Phytophthora kernoviae]RLN67772.1 hypothetical protein BBJ29_005587 [Phytophthora kernoviae]